MARKRDFELEDEDEESDEEKEVEEDASEVDKSVRAPVSQASAHDQRTIGAPERRPL